jgi:hypothetical protein
MNSYFDWICFWPFHSSLKLDNANLAQPMSRSLKCLADVVIFACPTCRQGTRPLRSGTRPKPAASTTSSATLKFTRGPDFFDYTAEAQLLWVFPAVGQGKAVASESRSRWEAGAAGAAALKNRGVFKNLGDCPAKAVAIDMDQRFSLRPCPSVRNRSTTIW